MATCFLARNTTHGTTLACAALWGATLTAGVLAAGCAGTVTGAPAVGERTADGGVQFDDNDPDHSPMGGDASAGSVDGAVPGNGEPDADMSSPDASVEPDPGPTPTAWPDATNTGVKPGVALTASGTITATTNGQVIENKLITGSVTVRANNVVVRNCRIRSGGTALELEDGYGGLIVEDVTIEGTSKDTGNFPPGVSVGVPFAGAASAATMRRVNLSGYPMGMRIFGGMVTVTDSYFHDLYIESGGQKLGRDAIEGWAGDHVVIQHNTLEVDADQANCVVKFPCDLPWDGRGTDILIDDNLLAGAGWTVCAGTECPGEPAGHLWSDVRVTNNHFSTRFNPKCGYYGPIGYAADGTTSGNVWHESGDPL